mmetsp:Transcript_47123/g.111927  ORF Transcript_47123/g.111927 Transcript_47123/m.111927 type:complete len:113 (+) Transcript_47123:77-415(+)
MRGRFALQLGLAALLGAVTTLLQGCTESCSSDGVVTVCCPSRFCKNDAGCCLKDPLNLCSAENGTGRLLEFVLQKKESGNCFEERASDPMIFNGVIRTTTTSSTKTITTTST